MTANSKRSTDGNMFDGLAFRHFAFPPCSPTYSPAPSGFMIKDGLDRFFAVYPLPVQNGACQRTLAEMSHYQANKTLNRRNPRPTHLS